jgi:uncharacterized protein YndB with AHSA1/START domain
MRTLVAPDAPSSTDAIERTVVLAASPARVFRALTDHREFGTWIRVDLDGPFVVGETVRGRMTYPGFEGYPFEARVEAIEPDRRFAFSWTPGIPEPGDDPDGPRTLVEFRLHPSEAGTVLEVRESGFNRLPDARRASVMRDNAEGWTEQLRNIAAHVGG